MKHCKDCEPAQENHFVAYTTVVLGWIDEPFFDLMERMFNNIAEKIADAITLPFFMVTVFLKLAHYTDRYDDKDTWRTKVFWDEAERRGIKMREFHLGPIRDGFIAEYSPKNGEAKKIICFDGLPRPGFKDSPALKWMDNKGIMKKKFLKEGLPVAPGGVAFTKRRALKIFNNITKPVITKPNLGSRSRHTMIHINTPEKLIVGFEKAKKLSPLVVIEEELRGYLFRGTLIGGKLAGVVQRDQPEVKGDGVHTLQELMDEENKRPERAGPIFHKITIDKEAEAELARQNIKLSDVVEKNRVVTFSQKTSRGCGGTTTEVTDITHPENIRQNAGIEYKAPDYKLFSAAAKGKIAELIRGIKDRSTASNFVNEVTSMNFKKFRLQCNDVCALTGVPVTWEPNCWNTGSVDRIDSNKGYTLDNIQITIWSVNRMKNDMTNDEAKTVINYLL